MRRFRPSTAAIAACATVAACLTACARRPDVPAPIEIIEYEVPWADAFPSDVVVDSRGRVWFTDRLVHMIGRFDPGAGTFERLTPPTAKSAPYGLVAGPDGGFWYAGSRAGLLGRIDPEREAIEEHVIPGARGGPQQLAWSNGVIWFSLRDSRSLGRYDPRTGDSRIIELEAELQPYGVAVTPDGRVWYSTMDAGYLVEVDPVTDGVRIHDLGEPPERGPFGTLVYADSTGRRHALSIRDTAEYVALPDSMKARVRINRVRARARRLAADSGGAIWLTDFRGNRIIRFDPVGRTHTSYRALSRGMSPYAIAVMRSGAVVYSETGIDAVTILDPESGERNTARIPTQQGTIRNVFVDEERGNIWLPLSDVGKLAVARFR